ARTVWGAGSMLPRGALFSGGKARKNVLPPMPAGGAMSPTVVRSRPCRPNRSNAACSSSARDVTRLRPARPAAGAAPRRAASAVVSTTGVFTTGASAAGPSAAGACISCARTTTGACHRATLRARSAARLAPFAVWHSVPLLFALSAITRPEEAVMTQQATMEAAPAGERGELAQASPPAEQNGTGDQALIADELLVEEVSIDG